MFIGLLDLLLLATIVFMTGMITAFLIAFKSVGKK